ncbi:MAG: zinc ribbon domain-containing protein [Gemmatimonadetes bacterium]|nr:zinc ribbon domain-containing protein [Gemmatimonadota bacterium]
MRHLRLPRQMPTYEYRCPDGHDFEKFTQKMSDAQSELACPTCGKVAARRLSAGGGLVFKGSGFYITDYGKDGKKDQRAAAKTDAASSASSTSTSSAATTGAASAPAAAPAAAPASAPAAPKSGTDK